MAFKPAWNGLTYRSSDKTDLVLGKRKRELVSQLPHAAAESWDFPKNCSELLCHGQHSRFHRIGRKGLQ